MFLSILHPVNTVPRVTHKCGVVVCCFGLKSGSKTRKERASKNWADRSVVVFFGMLPMMLTNLDKCTNLRNGRVCFLCEGSHVAHQLTQGHGRFPCVFSWQSLV